MSNPISYSEGSYFIPCPRYRLSWLTSCKYRDSLHLFTQLGKDRFLPHPFPKQYLLFIPSFHPIEPLVNNLK
jgi:hypothetical protein